MKLDQIETHNDHRERPTFMGTTISWLRLGFLYAGFVLLAIAGLLLFVASAFAFRFLLMAAFIVVLLGSLRISHFSVRFREWFKALGEQQISYNGLRLATDIALHPSHSWALISAENVAVGADDLMQVALGPVDAVELPLPGNRVKQGDCLFSLHRADRQVVVRSPVSGTVLVTNQDLLFRPGLINQEPFTEGWVVRLRADNVREDRRRLLQGNQAQGWFRHEIDRLTGTVLAAKAATPVLADGGTLVPDLYRQIDDTTWMIVTATFFGGAREV